MYAETIPTRADDETAAIEPRKTHPHYLTADEHQTRVDRVKALIADGLQRRQICAATGLGRTILNVLMKKHGLKSAPKPIESQKAVKLAALLKDGCSRADCASELGVTRSAISQMVRYHKLEEHKKGAPTPTDGRSSPPSSCNACRWPLTQGMLFGARNRQRRHRLHYALPWSP